MTNDRFVGYDAAEPPEEEPKYRCDRCGEGIYEGDSFYVIGGERVCAACVEDMREIA